MTYFARPTLLTVNGWKTVSFLFPDGRLDIPNRSILDALLTPPEPRSLSNLLQIYSLSSGLEKELKQLVEEPGIKWARLRKTLKANKVDSLSFKRVYNFVLQRTHGVPVGGDRNSEKDLQWFSNHLISRLFNAFVTAPREEQRAIFQQVEQNHLDLLEYLALEMQANYLMGILPYPYRPTVGIKKALSSITFAAGADGVSKRVKAIEDGDRDPINLGENYWLEATVLYRRILERFPTCCLVAERLKDFYRSPGMLELTHAFVEVDARDTRRWLDNVASLPSRPLELHQCVFCYRFRLEEVAILGGKERTGHNHKTLYCDRPECESLKSKR